MLHGSAYDRDGNSADDLIGSYDGQVIYANQIFNKEYVQKFQAAGSSYYVRL